MFPLKANEPYIKETGERSTLGAELGSGGGGGGYVLPVATAEVLGGVKIGSGINVDEQGTISVAGGGTATKIYYKDFNINNVPNIMLAQYANDAASSSGFRICYFGYNSAIIVNVDGYTPISAIAIDKYSGSAIAVTIVKYSDSYRLGLGISNKEISTSSIAVRVLYVENSNYTAIPS